MGLEFSGRALWRRRSVLFCALAILGMPGVAVAQTPAPAAALAPMLQASPAVPKTALGGDKSRTRFVIGLEQAVEFQVFSLSNPNRVIVELPDVKLQLPVIAGDAPVGLVRSFRGGLSAPGKSRVIIDVTGPVVVEKAVIEKGKDGKSPRLALEIVPVDTGSKAGANKKALPGAPVGALGAVGVQPPLPKRAVKPSERSAGIYKPVIVIDPGHGGHDGGANKNGASEKEVVLAMSLKLREKLVATGRYKVLMTRETDVFVDLDVRRDFAEKNKAALFIAVHADYAPGQARGATIYSLRDSTAVSLRRSAKGEAAVNALSGKELAAVQKADGDGNIVRNIFADLAQREIDSTKERTSVFARSVIEFMGASTSMQNNPDREAGFRVLKTAKVPSVLIELAFVSNRQDAQNLKSDVWRDKVAGSILTAIENYFSNQVARLPL